MIAANIMNTSFASVAPDARVVEAMRVLAEAAGASSVPVVGADGVLAGEVSAGVLLARAAGMQGGSCIEDLCVSDVMSSELLRVGPEAGVRELVRLLRDGDGGRIVHVVDDSGRLLGLITPGVLVERLCLYMDKTS